MHSPTVSPKPLTGGKVLLMLVAFFGVVFGVNFTIWGTVGFLRVVDNALDRFRRVPRNIVIRERSGNSGFAPEPVNGRALRGPLTSRPADRPS